MCELGRGWVHAGWDGVGIMIAGTGWGWENLLKIQRGWG